MSANHSANGCSNELTCIFFNLFLDYLSRDIALYRCIWYIYSNSYLKIPWILNSKTFHISLNFYSAVSELSISLYNKTSKIDPMYFFNPRDPCTNFFKASSKSGQPRGSPSKRHRSFPQTSAPLAPLSPLCANRVLGAGVTMHCHASTTTSSENKIENKYICVQANVPGELSEFDLSPCVEC